MRGSTRAIRGLEHAPRAKMVRVLRSPGGLVDFDGPVWMTEHQRQKFIEGMARIKPEAADVLPVQVPQREYAEGGPAREARRWEPEELLLLVSGYTNEQIRGITGRTEMSVQAHMGWFPQSFYKWMHDRGLESQPTRELIERFLEEVGHRHDAGGGS